jgi:hypothetical protein
VTDQEARSAAQDQPTCSYCGWLGWTVEKYGRVTHKQACPHRTDPWHQGDPPAAKLPWWFWPSIVVIVAVFVYGMATK